jgi:predicted RNase H-like HicB family nuclease
MNEYTIVIEDAGPNYGAYVLDFDGCIAVGDTIEEVTKNMQDAIAAHIAFMAEDGDPAPKPLGLRTATIAV